MSDMNLVSGTGICQKCGQQLLQLEEDGSKMCVVCKSKALIPGGGREVKGPAPTEEQMAKTLAAAGISAGHLVKQAIPVAQPTPVQIVPAAHPFDTTIRGALEIMRNLPMPKDVRQFKTISRIIAQMESLLQEK